MLPKNKKKKGGGGGVIQPFDPAYESTSPAHVSGTSPKWDLWKSIRSVHKLKSTDWMRRVPDPSSCFIIVSHSSSCSQVSLTAKVECRKSLDISSFWHLIPYKMQIYAASVSHSAVRSNPIIWALVRTAEQKKGRSDIPARCLGPCRAA